MKAFKKIVLTMLVSCLLIVPFMGTANAEALADPDNIKSIMEYFGIDINDANSIQNAIDEIREGGLSGILGFLGIDVADILNELQTYLDDISAATTLPQETESFTAEITTETPTEKTTTVPPAYTPAYPTYTQPAVSKPLPPKPAASTTKAPAETTEEMTTAEKTSYEGEPTEESTVSTDKTVSSVISEDTLLIIFITLVIFIAGLGTGIFVSRRISDRQREKEE